MRWPSLVIGFALTAWSMTAVADVVVVVSSKSTVTTLTRAQVADIFLGRARRFPDGVAAAPADQAEGAAVRAEFYERIVEASEAQIKAHWSKIIFTGRGQPPPTVANAVEMKKLLGENSSAIGYIERSQVDDTVRVVF